MFRWSPGVKVYETNVVGPVVLLQKLGPSSGRPRGANAIIVSSIRGLGGTPNHSPYGTSKATLNQLTKTLACEWGPKGVRVNAVLPGRSTPTMTTAMLPKELYDAYANIAPVGRGGRWLKIWRDRRCSWPATWRVG
jgi:NAD(P)-dependent dehydrogenase (short-subunit alcohol dehydrogenase family)